MSQEMTLPGVIPQWTLGDRLRKARELVGLSQTEMSEQLGIARNSVGRYESNVFPPSRPVLIAWAFRTGVALDWLVKGDPPSGRESETSPSAVSDALPSG